MTREVACVSLPTSREINASWSSLSARSATTVSLVAPGVERRSDDGGQIDYFGQRVARKSAINFDFMKNT
jgi:hypothetical protein